MDTSLFRKFNKVHPASMSDYPDREDLYELWISWVLEERDSSPEDFDPELFRAVGVMTSQARFRLKGLDEWSREFTLAQLRGVLSSEKAKIWSREADDFDYASALPEDLWRQILKYNPDFDLGCFRSSGPVYNYKKLYDRAEEVVPPQVDGPKGYTPADQDSFRERVAQAMAAGREGSELSTGSNKNQNDDSSLFAFLKDDDEGSFRGFLCAPLAGGNSRYSPAHSVWAFGAKNALTASRHGRAWVKKHYDTLAELQ